MSDLGNTIIRREVRMLVREMDDKTILSVDLIDNGDGVLSPFAGIGSEGYVSIKTGRRFVGVELKPSYYRIAGQNLRRAEEETQQRSLF